MLECRLTPAVNYWLGGTGDFATAGNWSDGVPTSDDDLIFDGSLTQSQFPNFGLTTTEQTIDGEGDAPTTPPPTSPPTSPPVFNPNANVTFASTVGTLYGSIHLRNGYSGTVTIPFDITFGGFEQTTGSIDQNSGTYQTAAHTISVNAVHATLGSMGGAFTWTGGVLNSGENAGVVSIVGMTNATIGDGTDSSYTTGSDLKLLSGTILNASGRIVLNNDAGLEVNELCLFQAPQPQPTIPPPVQKWASLLKGVALTADIKGLGKVALNGGTINDVNSTDLPILILGGTLNVVSVNLEVKSTLATYSNGTPWPAQSAPGVYMFGQSSKINIRDGRTLKAANGVLVEGGLLTTQTEANDIDGQPATSHVSYIDGWLKVYGGTISLSENFQGENRATSTLQVSGDIYLYGGSFTPRVYCDDPSVDQLKSDGKLWLYSAATIIPQVYHKSLAPTQNPNGQGLEWIVLWAKSGIDITNGMPTVAPPADWADPVTVQSGAFTGLKLKKLSAT